MIYNGKEIPKFGFGLMRLPMIDTAIDIEQTKEMVDVFLENGFTYFDTSFSYINQQSEKAIKLALVDRYPRESFQFATKMPAWTVKTKEEAQQMFYSSLERTGLEYFDFYLLHNLGPDRTPVFEEWDLWNFLAEQKKLGKIKNLGFSIHDNAQAVEEVLSKHQEVDFIQLQINYADWEDVTIQSRKCYEIAQKYNKPVVIMEPIRGGALANPPQKIKDIFDAVNSDMPYSVWALKYAASKENIITVLSGMSTIEQMKENVKYMKDMTPFTPAEEDAILEAQKALKTIPSIPCTGCLYCVKGCPKKINIPGILAARNKVLVFDDVVSAQNTYAYIGRMGTIASDCIECGKCESVCPQFIKIIDELKKSAEYFEA